MGLLNLNNLSIDNGCFLTTIDNFNLLLRPLHLDIFFQTLIVIFLNSICLFDDILNSLSELTHLCLERVEYEHGIHGFDDGLEKHETDDKRKEENYTHADINQLKREWYRHEEVV